MSLRLTLVLVLSSAVMPFAIGSGVESPKPRDQKKIAEVSMLKKTEKQRLAEELFKISTMNEGKSFECTVLELSNSLLLKNQFLIIKAGAATAGDDYYILANGRSNRILDARRDQTWIGNEINNCEIVFFDDNRNRVSPSSAAEVQKLRCFVFAQSRVFLASFKDNLYGFYDRSGRQDRD
jgi:hypothetical protein